MAAVHPTERRGGPFLFAQINGCPEGNRVADWLLLRDCSAGAEPEKSGVPSYIEISNFPARTRELVAPINTNIRMYFSWGLLSRKASLYPTKGRQCCATKGRIS